MSEESNKKLARRWFEQVWNQGDIWAIQEMYHPSGTATGFPDPDSVIRGPKEFAHLCQQFRDSFPDLRVTVDDVIAEGDRVAVIWTATMTHTGDALGFPASSKRVTLPGASFITCRDGRIIDGRNHMDFTKIRLELQREA